MFDFPAPADPTDDVQDTQQESGDGHSTSGGRLTHLRHQLANPRRLIGQGSRATDNDSAPSGNPDDDEFVARALGTPRQRLTTYAMRAAVLAALVSGPLALLTSAGSSTPTQITAPAPAVAADTEAQFAAADLAQQFVTAWLTTDRDNQSTLQRFVDINDTVTSLPSQPLYTVTDSHLAGIRRTTGIAGADTYAVTVSAQVTPAGSSTATRRYFQVPVVVSADGVRAVTMPAAVPGPATTLSVTLGYTNQIASNAAIVKAAQGFLSAMLTGSGDVARFTSPGTNLAAVTPAPFTAVTVSTARSQAALGDTADTPADGQRSRVLLTVTEQPAGTSSTSDALTGTYALTMVARAGRWEVTSLDPAPVASVSSNDQGSDDVLTGDSTDAPTSTSQDSETGGSAAPQTPQDRGTDSGDSDLLPTVTSEPNAPASSAPADPTTSATNSGGGSLLGPGGVDLGPR